MTKKLGLVITVWSLTPLFAAPDLYAQANLPAAPPAAPAHASLTAQGLTLLDVLTATVGKNPQLRIEEFTVDQQAGALRTTKGQFDWTLNLNGSQQRTYTPLTATVAASYAAASGGASNINSTVANNSSTSFQANKQFRDGITITPTMQATRTADNINYPGGINEAMSNLQIVFPLLRNRGRKAVDAQEIAADKILQATRMDLSQQVSDTLATASSRYWTFVAADATVALYRASEDRAREVLENSQALVDADRIPANDLNQARANLAGRTATRIAAEQGLLQARQQLVLVMGLGAEQIISLPGPAEDIPSSVPTVDPAALAAYLHLADTSRADVLAAQLRVDANLALQGASQNQVRPQLDLTGSAGYTGLREGTNVFDYPRSIVTPPKGVDFTVGFNYSQTPANDAAKGRLATAVATTRQSQITLSETSRAAATTVVVAFQGVRSTIAQLQKARESVQFYRAALDGEQEKYRLRRNSLVDVLTVEDRLTGAVVEEVNARLAYANAMVQLRQATGTIVAAGQDATQLDPHLFSELPPQMDAVPVTQPKTN